MFFGRSREALRSLCRGCSEWIVGCLWGAKRMIRVISITAFWAALSAVSAQVQIISNPVLTSWAPYQVPPTYTASPAVTPSACCAPPVVSFCDPCSSAAVPAAAGRTAYYAPPGTTYVVAPTTRYYVPRTTSYYVPTTTTYYGSARAPSVPATRVYYRPVTQMSSPGMSYVASATPTTSYYAPSVPTSSYSAPAASSSSTYSPAVPRSSCGCRGG